MWVDRGKCGESNKNMGSGVTDGEETLVVYKTQFQVNVNNLLVPEIDKHSTTTWKKISDKDKNYASWWSAILKIVYVD